MTNGEKIKEIFPSIELYEKSHDAIQINFNSVWWNAEYTEPSSSEKSNKSEIPTDSIIDWNNCHTSEQLDSIATTKKDLAVIHTEGLDEEIRCTMCTNSMKSDRGCDGSCVVNNAMYKKVIDAIEKRIQPTTKNDLGVDAVSRQAINGYIDYILSHGMGKKKSFDFIKKFVVMLPPATTQEPRKGEWLRMSDLSEKDDYRYKCSCCGNVIHHKSKMDLYTFNSWCGRCGSDNGRHINYEVEE